MDPIERCKQYRRRILEISRQVSAAHVAPAFSCLEIVDALYHDIMRPQDIFIMSKGHGWLAQYVVLEDLGIIDPTCAIEYCKEGGFGAHPDYAPEFGIHASTGSLGHGLGIAVGQALAERRFHGTDVQVYALLSDGECQEGSTWEAAMVAANLGLGNLIVLVDYNGWGGMDRVDEVHPASIPFPNKWQAFGWQASLWMVNGHNHDEIVGTIRRLARVDAKHPKAVVCDTVKGMGVSFIAEGQPLWHYRSPTEAEYQQALKELG